MLHTHAPSVVFDELFQHHQPACHSKWVKPAVLGLINSKPSTAVGMRILNRVPNLKSHTDRSQLAECPTVKSCCCCCWCVCCRLKRGVLGV
jgi:hypothetical protein